MPIACSSSVLTGVDGSIYFEPAGTQYCLLDNSDFASGTSITVPADNDYRVDDPVAFKVEGSGKLDSALTAGTTYYVVKRTAVSIDVSATKGGTAITLNGDGGLGAPSGGVVTTLTLPTLPTSTGSAPAGIATAITPASLPTASGHYGAGPYVGVATAGGTGTGLTVTVTVVGSNVTAVAIANGGSGYTASDTITIDGALLGGTKTTDDITFTVNTVSAIKPGVYGPGPITGIATTGGTGGGLTVDATVVNGEITGLTLNAGGTGYKTGESLTVDGASLGGTTGTNDLLVTTGTTSAIVAGGNTAGVVNHIELGFAEYQAVCSVTEWDLSMTKEQADVTTLPCSVGTGANKVAPVRKQIGTFLSGEGSMSILFTSDQTSMGQRLLANSVMVDSKVDAKLYIDAVSGGATIDDAASSYFEGSVNLLGFEISVNTSDALIATVNFSLADQPKALFGVKL